MWGPGDMYGEAGPRARSEQGRSRAAEGLCHHQAEDWDHLDPSSPYSSSPIAVAQNLQEGQLWGHTMTCTPPLRLWHHGPCSSAKGEPVPQPGCPAAAPPPTLPFIRAAPPGHWPLSSPRTRSQPPPCWWRPRGSHSHTLSNKSSVTTVSQIKVPTQASLPRCPPGVPAACWISSSLRHLKPNRAETALDTLT